MRVGRFLYLVLFLSFFALSALCAEAPCVKGGFLQAVLDFLTPRPPPLVVEQVKPRTFERAHVEIHSNGAIIIEGGEVTIRDRIVKFETISYKPLQPGETPKSRAETALGAKLGKEIGHGGVFAVYAHPTDPSKVVKVLNPFNPMRSDLTSTDFIQLFQRQIALAPLLESIVAPLGVKVAKISFDPALTQAGILIQDRVSGKPIHKPHRLRKKDPKFKALLETLEPWNDYVRLLINERYGLRIKSMLDFAAAIKASAYSIRDTPHMYSDNIGVEMGFDYGNDYGNIFQEDATGDFVFIDW